MTEQDEFPKLVQVSRPIYCGHSSDLLRNYWMAEAKTEDGRRVTVWRYIEHRAEFPAFISFISEWTTVRPFIFSEDVESL